MKIINRLLTEEFEFSDILRNERLYQPSKQGIRRGWRNNNRRPDYKYPDTKCVKFNVDRFILRNVGRPFDEVFSELCNKREAMRRTKRDWYFGDLTTKEKFIKRFVTVKKKGKNRLIVLRPPVENRQQGSRTPYNNSFKNLKYIIDKNGNIQIYDSEY